MDLFNQITKRNKLEVPKREVSLSREDLLTKVQKELDGLKKDIKDASEVNEFSFHPSLNWNSLRRATKRTHEISNTLKCLNAEGVPSLKPNADGHFVTALSNLNDFMIKASAVTKRELLMK